LPPPANPAPTAAPPDSGKPAAPEPAPAAAKPATATAPPKTLPQLAAALNAEKTDRGLRLVMPADALFQAHRAALDAAAAPLATLAALVAAMQPREIVVIGHTDSVGEDDANLTLSKDQAHAVAAWLSAHATKQRPHFIEQGYGRTRPVAPNHNPDGSDNPQGQAGNRRLEILLRR
jgi:outer membrane protein OmpA-like peptidoglycan-associated protein